MLIVTCISVKLFEVVVVDPIDIHLHALLYVKSK